MIQIYDTQRRSTKLAARRLKLFRTTPRGGFRRWDDRSTQLINTAIDSSVRRVRDVPAVYWVRGRWIEMREHDQSGAKSPAAAVQDFDLAMLRGLDRTGFSIESAKELKLSEFWRLIVADEEARKLLLDEFMQGLETDPVRSGSP